MSFIEDLRQKRAAEASAKAAKEEAESRARVSQQEYDRRQRENDRLRERALTNSYANNIIKDLTHEHGVRVSRDAGRAIVRISDYQYDPVFGNKTDNFSVSGNTDGSINIGKTVLSVEQAKDPKLVNDAFKEAKRTAEPNYGGGGNYTDGA